MKKVISIMGTVKIFILFFLILGRSYTSYSTTVQGVDVFNKTGHYKVTMIFADYSPGDFAYTPTPGSTVVGAYVGGMTESFEPGYQYAQYPVPTTLNMQFNGGLSQNFGVTKATIVPHTAGMVSDAFMYYTDIT